MTNTHPFQKKIDEVQALFNQLKAGQLSKDEIQDLTALTRELYERSIILQYKVFEGTELAITNESEAIPEVVEEIQLIEEIAIEEEEVEAPAFDLSLFEEQEEEIREEEIIAEEIAIEEILIEEEVALEEEIIEIEEHPAATIVEMVEEVSIPATHVQETPAAAPTSNSSLVESLRKLVDPSESQFGMGGLSTLIGSYGLNERLLYINELFGGSSEAFANAIQQLDSCTSFDESLAQVANFSQSYNWNLNSESVSDFINKLKRRYA
ncbi:MAG: hypothetical protein V4638_01585 [Bacteroidota bacterium]